MEILFTECPIASVLLADWSKYPIKVTVVQPAFLFLDCIWINPCSCSYLLQPDFFNLYNNWSNFSIFAVVTPIWLASHFLILEFSFWKSVIYSNWSHSLYLWIGVNSSYFQILLQFHHICFYSRWSIIFIFQILLQIHHVCFYSRWSAFSIFQISLQFLRICFYFLWSIIPITT